MGNRGLGRFRVRGDGAGPMTDADAFEWLKNPRGRRSSLVGVHTAVRRGWLAGDEMAGRRKALVDALVGLLDDPTLRPNEEIRIIRIFQAMLSGGEPPSRVICSLDRLISRLRP